MKKFTSLLLLALTFVGAAKAQLPDGVKLSDANNKYKYNIGNSKDANAGYYVTSAPTGASQQLGSAKAFTDQKKKAVFIFEAAQGTDATNGVKIKLEVAGQYYEVGVASDNTNGGLIKSFEANAQNAVWKFVRDGQTNNYKLQYKNASGTWKDGSWNMYGGPGNDIKTYEGGDAGSKWYCVEEGQVGKVGELNHNQAYILKSARTTNTNNYYLIYDPAVTDFVSSNFGSGNDKFDVSQPQTNTNMHWVVYKGQRGTYLYNVGAQKFVASSTDGGSKPVALSATVKNGVQLRETGKAGNYRFLISTNNWALNLAQTQGAHGVVSWSGGQNVLDDLGNCYQFIPVTTPLDQSIVNTVKTAVEYFENIAPHQTAALNAANAALSKIETLKAEGQPGYHLVNSTTNTQDITTLANDVKTNYQTMNVEALTSAKTQLEAFNNLAVEANVVTGKYFRIAAANPERYYNNLLITSPYYTTAVDAQNNPNGIDHRQLEVTDPATANPAAVLWQLEVVADAKDRYYITNVNSGLPLGKLEGNPTNIAAKKESAAKYKLAPYTATANNNDDWNLSEHSTQGQYLCSNGSVKTVTRWSDGQDPGAGWKFEEVTSLTVKVGAAKYATLNLPMTVEIADKTSLKAYIGTINSGNANEFVVTEIADGIIPANTPVILYGAENTYTLNIVSKNSTTNVQGNQLKGTTIANHKMSSGNYYGLGVLSNQKVGFKVAQTPNMPANKAYLEKTAGNQPAALSFVFEGEQTGINGVVTNDTETNVYYDLNGRRVLYPTTGIYVNAKGQKVFLK